VVTEVYNLVDAESGNVRKYSFKRQAIPVHIRDCSKFHLALPFEMADDLRNAGGCRPSDSL
jgi:hypothetical protein